MVYFQKMKTLWNHISGCHPCLENYPPSNIPYNCCFPIPIPDPLRTEHIPRFFTNKCSGRSHYYGLPTIMGHFHLMQNRVTNICDKLTHYSVFTIRSRQQQQKFFTGVSKQMIRLDLVSSAAHKFQNSCSVELATHQSELLLFRLNNISFLRIVAAQQRLLV